VDVRLLAAVTGSLEGVNVAALCHERGISRKTFYKWRARYAAEGLAGLEPRPRRPKRSPGATSRAVEDRIVELRKQLDDDGLDAGPSTIQWHLGCEGITAVPSVATIWRVLVRRGFVVPQPQKRPKAATCRFETQFPNECWQIDFTEWTIGTGRVVIFNIIDDHSRLAVASVAAPAATTEAAWDVFCAAARRWGLPVRCLSDNGLAFSGRLRGFEVAFEANLRAAGIVPITSRPYHPQTCGKVERFQQTLKRWLRKRPRLDATIEELEADLDVFVDYYNYQRPHRGIGRRTPIERWSASSCAVPDGTAIPAPLRRTRIIVGADGVARGRPWKIGLGVDYAGQAADVVIQGHDAAVFIGDQLIRQFQLDSTRHYQPSGRRRGGPRRPRPNDLP